jgi:two-component system, LuxR family, response regulator FixJ
MKEPIKTNPLVHIIDDDEAVRDAISMLLDSVNIDNKGYASAQLFLEQLSTVDIHNMTGCIVLDIRMPGISGLDCQIKLSELGCTLPIIFITGHGDVPMAVEAMKKGALEFIQKPFREQELLDCIQHAMEINKHNQAQQQQAEDIKIKISTLTPREAEIMAKVIAGQANKAIAIDLNLSQRTVEIHRANVMEKMQVKSLPELVKLVMSLT